MARLLLIRALLAVGLGALALAGAPGRAMGAAGQGAASSGDRWVWPGPPDVEPSWPAFHDPTRDRDDYLTRNNLLWTLSPDPPRVWTPHPIVPSSSVGSASDAWVLDPAGDRMLTVHDRIVVSDTCCTYRDEDEVWQLTLSDTPGWTQLPVKGPRLQHRDQSMMAYDSRRHRVLVFGGHSPGSGAALSSRVDVLSAAGDSAAWTGFEVSDPALPVMSACAFYDSVGDRVLAVGGSDSLGHGRATIYELDLAAPSGWTPWVTADSVYAFPDPYSDQIVWLDSDHRRLVWITNRTPIVTPTGTYGGDSVTVKQLSLDAPTTWQTVPYGGRTPLFDSHQALYDAQAGRIAVYGVTDRNDLAELALDGASGWVSTRFSEHNPYQHGGVLLPDSSRGMLFYSSDVGFLWRLDPGSNAVWRSLVGIGPRPPRRSSAATVYDPVSQRGWVYGGNLDGAELGDLWQFTVLDSVHVQWTRILTDGDAPAPRWGAAAVLDPLRNRMIVAGGFAGEPVSDTWALALQSPIHWTRLADRGLTPSVRLEANAVYDSRRDAMLVFGGLDPQLSNATWELSFADGDTWFPLSTVGSPPAPRIDHQVVYDALRDRMIVLWGQTYTGAGSDCMELDLADGTWRPFTPGGMSPQSRQEFGAAYDPNHDQLVIVGGLGNHPGGGALPTVLYADFSANPVRTPPPTSGPPLAVLGLAPNPTRDAVSVAFDLPVAATVHGRIYNAAGRLVRDLGDRKFVAGRHALLWDGKSDGGGTPASGVYFARVSMLGRDFSGKFVYFR